MSSNKRLSIKQAEIEADDLIIEILLCLPSVVHFKAVCKQWHSLITSSSFRELWRRRNFKPAAGLILFKEDTSQTYRKVCFVPFSSNTPKTISSDFTIEQSCNGLLLCRTRSGHHVYNPTTMKSVILPKLDGQIRQMTLAYDPTKSPYYKVITSTLHGNYLIQPHIYSSRTCRWTLISEPRPHLFLNRGIYGNGSIHWIESLLYFNIENKSVKAMPVPPDCTYRIHNYFGESCGRLSYVTIGKSTPCFIDVYELKRDYSWWVWKYHISVVNCDYTSKILSVVHGLEEDDSFLVLRIENKIVRYNLRSKTSEELHELVPQWKAHVSDLAFQYIESLCGV